ncbi:MAG: adenylate/guanylate cyclase domain-containing protein [Alphaproteobacteria bacterium]|nr:adenylate/guanylate cyclase domain-containing protein [Alphaproteobacteria bacterium]
MNRDVEPVVQWLIDGARTATMPQEVLATLCDRVVACGIPLWRVAVFVRTLHPNLAGRRFEWQLGKGVTIAELPFQALDEATSVDSPVLRVCQTGLPIRCRLDIEPADSSLPALELLRSEGVTDYWATPLLFSNGEVHGTSWATRQAGGFTEEETRAIGRLLAPLARVAEIHALRRTAINLLDAYVGRRSGERILSGAIRRGETETIHAAIWLSDMRGFTPLADRLPPAQLLAILNRYFDCQIPAITRHGGEILKFIGDGLLAIFPIDETNVATVCANALAAAQEASAALALVAAGPDVGAGGLRFGIALHVGEVEYGNMGGEKRLDFTCIGPAVNLAARLEKLTGKLDCHIVASSAFASHCPTPLQSIGEFALAGFARPETIYTLQTTS